MPDILPVCMQDFLHGGKSDMRTQEVEYLLDTQDFKAAAGVAALSVWEELYGIIRNGMPAA